MQRTSISRLDWKIKYIIRKYQKKNKENSLKLPAYKLINVTINMIILKELDMKVVSESSTPINVGLFKGLFWNILPFFSY